MKKQCICGTIVLKDTGELGGYFRCSECATKELASLILDDWWEDNKTACDDDIMPPDKEKIAGRVRKWLADN